MQGGTFENSTEKMCYCQRRSERSYRLWERCRGFSNAMFYSAGNEFRVCLFFTETIEVFNLKTVPTLLVRTSSAYPARHGVHAMRALESTLG